MTNVIPLPEGLARGAAIGLGTSPGEIAQGLRKRRWQRVARDQAIERYSTASVANSWTSLCR